MKTKNNRSISTFKMLNKELDKNEIKNIALQILKNVSFFCEKNNITYYLACGTLLGSIKYNGFIPWDDDIDIMMPRPDYDKFMSIYKNERYKLLKPDEGLFYYAKVYDTNTIKYENGIDYKKYRPIGVDIDIFPLDGIVNDEKIIKKLMKNSARLELLLRLAKQPIFYRKNPIKCINRIIPRIIGSKNIIKMIEKNAQTYLYENSDYVIRMRNTPNGFTGALKKDIYNPPIKKTFEDEEYYVPREYDIWLKRFYGDNYLTELPPEEKRVAHHKNKCYLKENINA